MTSPIGSPLAVDGDRGAVVDVLDLLGHLGQQLVWVDGERLAVDQRPARRGERDHPARDIGVERADDDGRAVLPRGCQHLVGGRDPIRGDQHRGAELDRLQLRVGPVTDDHDVAV